jgi:hypothetical protein
MKDFALGLLPVLLPILVAGITTTAFEYFQKLLGIVEALPAIAKQVAVTVLAYCLTYLGVLAGVTISPDLAAIGPDDFSALLSAGLAFLFHQGVKTKALANRVGGARLPLLLSLLFVGACGLIGAGSGKVPPASPGVTMEITFMADTASVRMACRPVGTVCRWTSNFGIAPDGPEAVFKLPAPTPGDSVQVVGTAHAVRRGLVSVEPNNWAAWVKRNDVPPPAPDSVIVVEILVPPVID